MRENKLILTRNPTPTKRGEVGYKGARILAQQRSLIQVEITAVKYLKIDPPISKLTCDKGKNTVLTDLTDFIRWVTPPPFKNVTT